MDPIVLANRYAILSVLGEGGMGTVYRVADKLDGLKQLALKTIKTGGEVTQEQRLRFKEEFRAMARLKHPNTIAVQDFGQLDEKRLYIVMELVPGRELAEVMSGRAMPLNEVYPLLLQLLHALYFIHERGFVHRDIKSQNIHVTPEGHLKLMDFGLMGQLGQPSTRSVTGSPGYMAPEVAIGGIIDASSDLYSVGCLAYEMVTGQLPFVGTLSAVVRAHIGERPASPTTLRPELPARLAAVITRLLEKEQVRRYRTAGDVIDDLSALAGLAVSHENLDQSHSYLTTSMLVGRDKELAELERLRHEALAGTGRGVMIMAPAGTGKSRMVQELLLHAKLEGTVVLHGACVEAGMAPYEALGIALKAGLAHGTEEESERFVAARNLVFPEHACPDPTGPPPDVSEIAEATLHWLQSLSRRVPLLFLMDDLHWADPQTVTIFNHCIRNMGAHRVLCVGTFRNDELPVGHPAWYTLEDGSASALTLGPLSFEEQSAFITAMLGDVQLRAPFAHALDRATGGNAFYLTELLRVLMEDGLLVHQAGCWRFPAELEVLAPLSSVEATIHRRLGHLGKEARRLAGVAAVLGRRQTLAQLQAVVGQGDDEMLSALEELEDRQFLVREGDQHIFPHDRLREVLYERLEPGLRATLHQRAGEYMEAHPGPDTVHDLHALAHHYSHGLDPASAYRCLLAAADQACEAGADVTALDLWVSAERALAQTNLPERATLQLKLWLGIGREAVAIRPADAATALSRLAAALETWEGEPPELPYSLAHIYGLLATTQGFGGNPREALRAAARAEELQADPSPFSRALLIFQRCTALMSMGRYDEAVARGQEAEELFDRVPILELPTQFMGPAIGSRSIQNTLAYMGYQPSLVLAEEACDLAKQLDDPRPLTVFIPFGIYAAWSGRTADATAYVEETMQKCRDRGAPPYPFMLYVRGHLHWQRGEFASALALLDRSLAFPDVHQSRLAVYLMQALRGQTLIDLERVADAEVQLTAAHQPTITEGCMHMDALFRIALARAATTRGDGAGAIALLEPAYRMMVAGPARNPLAQAQAARQWAHAALLSGDRTKARQLTEEALAIVSRPGIDNPLEQAHTLLLIAEIARVRGEQAEATIALRRAGDLYHGMQNNHWLHVTLQRLEALAAAPAAQAAKPSPEASVEARWKFARGAML